MLHDDVPEPIYGHGAQGAAETIVTSNLIAASVCSLVAAACLAWLGE